VEVGQGGEGTKTGKRVAPRWLLGWTTSSGGLKEGPGRGVQGPVVGVPPFAQTAAPHGVRLRAGTAPSRLGHAA